MTAIKNGLQKSAKEVLEYTDDVKKTAKNADESKQIDEVIKHFDEIAEATNATEKAMVAFRLVLRETISTATM